MNATTYTGNGTGLGSTQTIVNGAAGQAFQPDFSWIKNRGTTDYHNLTDIVRGISGTGSPILSTNVTSAESTPTGYGVSALNSNGFTLIGNGSYTNATGNNYVAWQWKANGAAVTNTAGTISSQVSANTTSGFSIVTWTGSGAAGTVGHGLGVAPAMVIKKDRSVASIGYDVWMVYHQNASATPQNGFLYLNATNAFTTDSTAWNNTAPTSSVFSLGASVNANVGNVAYCWAPIAGYSAFGSYAGNGSNDGPFVYLGFRPRFVMIKCSSDAQAWIIFDTARNPYNSNLYELYPNLTLADSVDTNGSIDIVSNGFKNRNAASASLNASGQTYIYACWAENPFKYSNAR
jgi:hypothetical protein